MEQTIAAIRSRSTPAMKKRLPSQIVKPYTYSLEQRHKIYDLFLSKVGKTDTCWIWFGPKNSQGYGQFSFNGYNYRAHRFIWSYFNGEQPAKMCICHKCDNPSCVKPSHLFLVTYSENRIDAIKKGRIVAKCGEDHPRAKLTNKDVAKIREIGRKVTLREMGKEFGVNITSIDRVILNKSFCDPTYIPPVKKGQGIPKKLLRQYA